MDKTTVDKDVSWLGARLREPSSYNAIAVVAGLLGVAVNPGIIQDVALIGAGIGGLIGFVLPEGNS